MSYARVLEQLHLSPRRIIRYFDYVMRGVPLQGRTVLDVGGGSGIASFYMASRGAQVRCLEPGGAGAAGHLPEMYQAFSTAMDSEVEVVVELDRRGLEDLEPNDGPFAIVLLHNVVNHLNEDACAVLHQDRSAELVFDELFTKLRMLVGSGGHLILADVGRRNLLGNLGIPNPFAPTIDWRIHQQPGTWIRLLRRAGFLHPRVRWDAPGRTGRLGQVVLGNRLGAWLTSSHFIITMRAP